MIQKFFWAMAFIVMLLCQCKKIATSNDDTTGPNATNPSTYTGTASVSKGIANTITSNLFTQGIRVAAVGSITSLDNKIWTVPGEVNFNLPTFPFASDLYNSYVSGHSYANASAAISALSGNDIITIDASGEVFTAYVFGDNYFEMYINGIPVGKDAVPYTEFNSSIIRFKVSKPFTIALKCVDWEENLGLGTELQGSNPNYVGDGGFVAVIKNATGVIESITDNSWKAQTFYTSPVVDLTCLSENNNYRLSTNCSTTSATTNSYAVHWSVPDNWNMRNFDDNSWPMATLFSNATVGVNNKPSYTNFTDIFDNSANDASFIWSTNLLLDNLVLLRKKVQ